MNFQVRGANSYLDSSFDGNLYSIVGWVVSQNENTSMTYDYENRLHVHTDHLVSKKVTYTYSGDGLKRREVSQTGVVTTFVWDGSEYLQDRS
ncbi:hypothetical protein CCB80_09165 [Armatimonadetes bacterium Uphvl-Ar1]|nr:hypothetical protein CCB80_09165 [Armatimonadetes bacterium Uphvl-Ar1]